MISTIFVIILGLICASAEKCDLKYVDFSSKGPVLLQTSAGKYNLIPPENDGIYFNPTQQIILACPGDKNKFSSVNGNPINTTCIGKKSLRIEPQGPTKTLGDLKCDKPITGEAERTTINCESVGKIIHIGQRVANQFLSLIDVCFDDMKTEALYSAHTIYGSAIKYSGKSSERPVFKVGGLLSFPNPDQYYTKSAQKETFAKLLNSAALANKYITDNSFLAKGHLAPDKDQVFIWGQQSTYFYINAVPQWQQINNGNWKSLENALKTALPKKILRFTQEHSVY